VAVAECMSMVLALLLRRKMKRELTPPGVS